MPDRTGERTPLRALAARQGLDPDEVHRAACPGYRDVLMVPKRGGPPGPGGEAGPLTGGGGVAGTRPFSGGAAGRGETGGIGSPGCFGQ